MIDLGQAQRQYVPKYKPPQKPVDPVQAFAQVLAEHGLEPGAIITGELVRANMAGRSDKTGWYVFHDGEISAGAFGDWRTGTKQKWCSVDTAQLNDKQAEEYRQQQREFAKIRAQELERRQAKAKTKANWIWQIAKPADPSHEYLKRKNVPVYGIRQIGKSLLVPLIDQTGQIWSLQFINPGGRKLFLKGGKKKGLSFTIPGNTNTYYIGEGYSTMATIHLANGAACVCAMDAGNLPPAAKAVREGNNGQIVICADNDRFTSGNPGITKAKEAAKSIGADIVIPDFTGLPGADDEDLKLSDFNDLAHAACRLEIVTEQIQGGSIGGTFPPLPEVGTLLKNVFKRRPDPIKFLFKYNDQGLIPRGVVGVLTATGGVGKTYFLSSLAVAAASGGSFGPIKATTPTKTLMIVAEDPQDEMGRRFWDICKGTFPSLLHAVSIYGELGPLMRLSDGMPEPADTYYWLEQTIIKHPGLGLLILDPKSRLYGLKEDDNDHATQWIRLIEGLAKKYDLTILFSHHTAKDPSRSERITQASSRGASAIVDGCRWQAGLARMSRSQGEYYGLLNPRQYIVFDAPKSNYAADLPEEIIFKRGEFGVLEYVEPHKDRRRQLGQALFELLDKDPEQYTKEELIKRPKGKGIFEDMVEKIPNFQRKRDMMTAIDWCIQNGKLQEIKTSKDGTGRKKTVLSTAPF